jgi:hypothetical protein
VRFHAVDGLWPICRQRWNSCLIDQHNHNHGARNPRGLEIGSPVPTWVVGDRPGVFNDQWDDLVNHIDETPREVWFQDDLDYFDDIKDSSGVRIWSSGP